MLYWLKKEGKFFADKKLRINPCADKRLKTNDEKNLWI